MQVPVAEGVFTWPADDPQLIGSRCADCGMVTFPTQDSCPRCASTEMAEHAAGAARHAVDVDHAGVPAAAAVRRSDRARTSCRSASATSSCPAR